MFWPPYEYKQDLKENLIRIKAQMPTLRTQEFWYPSGNFVMFSLLNELDFCELFFT